MTTPTLTEILAEADRTVREAGRAVLAQVVRAEGSTPARVGWKLVVRPDGSIYGNLGGGAFEGMVIADAEERLAALWSPSGVKRYYLTETATQGEATGMACGGLLEVLLEVLAAPPLLVVCGGGPVGQAVARVGGIAGFDTLVVDDREAFRRPELFPSGTRISSVHSDYREDFLAPVAERELWVAIVSRCWETDAAALAGVLRQSPPRLAYLGLMGSQRKIGKVKSEVETRGHSLDGVRLHAPIGLPIGGDTPGEIAISILAEIVRERPRVAAALEPSEASPARSAPVSS